MTAPTGISRRQALTIAAGVAENREVSGHAEGRSTLRKLRAVRTPVVMQNRGWNGCRAGLVHRLCEEAGIKSSIRPLNPRIVTRQSTPGATCGRRPKMG